MVRTGGASIVPLLAILAYPPPAYSQTVAPVTAALDSVQGRELSVAQIRTFLKDAKVLRTRGTPKGVTAPSQRGPPSAIVYRLPAKRAVPRDKETSVSERRRFMRGPP